jgi:hypothetical protein
MHERNGGATLHIVLYPTVQLSYRCSKELIPILLVLPIISAPPPVKRAAAAATSIHEDKRKTGRITGLTTSTSVAFIKQIAPQE